MSHPIQPILTQITLGINNAQRVLFLQSLLLEHKIKYEDEIPSFDGNTAAAMRIKTHSHELYYCVMANGNEYATVWRVPKPEEPWESQDQLCIWSQGVESRHDALDVLDSMNLLPDSLRAELNEGLFPKGVTY